MKKISTKVLTLLLLCLFVISFYSCTKENSAKDVRLETLAVSAGTLMPTFNLDCYSYSLDIATRTSISIECKALASEANVLIAGKNAQDEDLLVDKDIVSNISPGLNTLNITVSSGDAKPKSYKILITASQDPASDKSEARLTALNVSIGTLSPSFSSSIYSYSVDIDKATSVDIIPVAINSASIISMKGLNADGNDLLLTANNVSNITGGDNVLSINVAAEDKSVKTYTLTIKSFKDNVKPVISLPAKENLIAYINFDGVAKDETSIHSIAFSDISFAADRKDEENKAASFDGAGQMLEIAAKDGLFAKNITISYWVKIHELTDGTRFHFGLGGTKGCLLEMGSFDFDSKKIGLIKFASNHKNEGTAASKNGTAWSEYKGERDANSKDILYELKESIMGKFEDKWVQLAFTYNSNTSIKTFYIDAVKVCEMKINYSDSATPEWNLTDLQINTEAGLVENFAIGAPNSKSSTKPDSWTLFNEYKNRTFKGLMDDFRIFNTDLTADQIKTLNEFEK